MQSVKPFFIFLLLLVSSYGCIEKEALSENKDKSFCDHIKRDSTIWLSKEMAPWSDRVTTETGVIVLEDGAGAMVSRAWLSEYAEQSIDMQYFIFSIDNVGLIACDYLVRAADRGVKVRILVDDIMVDADIEDILMLASHKNIEIKIYN